ncbi:MAG: SPOR domain-containing protein [Pseudomonadota bacterium]|nr:SPOR domain-containing protein [Pseudomonadota bacterium]
MTNPSPPELLPQRPIRSEFGRAPSYRARRLLTVAAVLIIAGFGLHYVFGGPSTVRPVQIPTLVAEGPYKQRPEQPGGIDIPHQDVQVYQALDNKEDAKPAVEHLLPPPEAPQETAASSPPRSADTAAVATPSEPQTESLTPSRGETTDQVMDPSPHPPPFLVTPRPSVTPPIAPPSLGLSSRSGPSVSPSHAPADIVAPPAPAPAAAVTEAPAPMAIVPDSSHAASAKSTEPAPSGSAFPSSALPSSALPSSTPARSVSASSAPNKPDLSKREAATASKSPAKGSARALTIEQVLKATKSSSNVAESHRKSAIAGSSRIIQLAAVQEEGTAQAMANKLQTQYAATLGAAELRVVRADLGQKGIYYRIQSQPISASQASNICAALKKVKEGCILVRP